MAQGQKLERSIKIAIVGAGVSGLSLYLQLQKISSPSAPLEITIYERHSALSPGQSVSPLQGSLASVSGQLISDTTSVVGNNIGLPPQTVKLLKQIDEKIYEKLHQRGYPNFTFRHRTARGHEIALTSTNDGSVDAEPVITCSRQSFWQILTEVVGTANIIYREVSSVRLDGERPVIEFSDGAEVTVDLVVGADGSRSVVKKAFFACGEVSDYLLHYEGFCGMGGYVDAEIPESVTKHNSMVFTSGSCESFGYCSIGPTSAQKLGWWFNWSLKDLPRSNHLGLDFARKLLRERLEHWEDPVIQFVVNSMSAERIYPIWTTPKLPRWGDSKVVLVGDAAHTVQATSGLGASLAVEDSIVFSSLLAHLLQPTGRISFSKARELAAAGLYKIQAPKASLIQDQTRRRLLTRLKLHNILFEYMSYLYLYLWTNFSMLGRLIQGGVEMRSSEDMLEQEIQKYLQGLEEKL